LGAVEAGGRARTPGCHPALLHVVSLPQRPPVRGALDVPAHGCPGPARLAEPEAAIGGAGIMNSPAAATPWQAWKRDHGGGAGERATPAAETVHRQDTVARPVFIVGTGRCGSTLVHEVLARHPAFGFISTVDDRLAFLDPAGRWNGVLLRSPLARAGSGARWRFAPSEAYRLIGTRVSPMYVNSTRDLTAADVTPWIRRRFRAFFEARARAQRCPQFLHKYTGWPRLGFFAGIFPEARFVHVVR